MPDAAENDEIDDGDCQQKERRRPRADDAADHLEFVEVTAQRERRGRNRRHGDRHDKRMTERKKQTNRNRPLALLHQLAHDIVDRGDMIRIDGVAQTEHISENSGAEQRRPPGQCDNSPCPD